MDHKDELKDIPPMIPDRDDVDSHLSNRRSQKDEIVRPSYYAERVTVSTWPVRVVLAMLCLVAGGGAYGGARGRPCSPSPPGQGGTGQGAHQGLEGCFG